MLADVQALHFFFRFHAQPDGQRDELEQNERGAKNPHKSHGHTDQLRMKMCVPMARHPTQFPLVEKQAPVDFGEKIYQVEKRELAADEVQAEIGDGVTGLGYESAQER